MSLQKEITLRYQVNGHVRFQLPKLLCEKYVADFLYDAILQIEGVYQVYFYHKQGKLSIRYVNEICDFNSLAKQLSALFSNLEQNGYLEKAVEPEPKADGFLTKKFKNLRATRWAKDKYQEGKQTAKAVGFLAKIGLKKKPDILKDPEKTLIDFFNDVIVLYLVKTHWHLITQHWLLKPYRYRYEWMGAFYLMYLLMRSKMPKK